MYGQVENQVIGAIAVAILILVLLAAGAYANAKFERDQRERNAKLPKRPPFRRGYDD